MRLFAALALPHDATLWLERLQSGLPEGRQVPPDSFHVTLGFFGDCNRHVAADIDAALACEVLPGIDIRFDGIGIFGGAEPRVLHVAVRPDTVLKLLRRRVLAAARDAGLDLPRERFIPHVTLARFAPGTVMTPELDRWIAPRAGARGGPWRIDAACLYRSDPGSGGPSYMELARYPLG